MGVGRGIVVSGPVEPVYNCDFVIPVLFTLWLNIGMQNNPVATTSLQDHFQRLPDPRVGRAKRHELLDIMLISVCAMLCGAESFTEMAQFGRCKADWFRTWLRLPHGIPSHDTFNRVFGLIDPNKFMDCFLAWTQSLRTAVAGELVALDGKTVRRSRARTHGPIHLVNVWSRSRGIGARAIESRRPQQRDHGLACPAAGVGVGRLRGDGGRDGLPERGG